MRPKSLRSFYQFHKKCFISPKSLSLFWILNGWHTCSFCRPLRCIEKEWYWNQLLRSVGSMTRPLATTIMKLRGRNSMWGGQMTIEIKYILFRPQSFMMVVANGRWNRFHHRSFSIQQVRRIFKKNLFWTKHF